MEKSEKYLSYTGEELRTPKGKVITVRDVAREQALHSLDRDGNIVVPTSGWYWLKFNVLDPDQSEWYATYEEKTNAEGKTERIPGGPDSPRKINSVRLWYDEKDPTKSQLIFDENDYNKEKGTVGEISPLALKTDDGTYVAVQDASRFGLAYVEVFRRGWSRPKEEAPEVKQFNESIKVTRFTDEQLGLIVTNNARIDAPAGKQAYVSTGLSLLEVKGTNKPELKGARWIPVEAVLTSTEEVMGKSTIQAAVVFGHIQTDPIKLQEYLAQMPKHVRETKEALKNK
jgi:hypothetical protein